MLKHYKYNYMNSVVYMSLKHFLKEKQIILSGIKMLHNPSIEDISKFIRDSGLQSLRWGILEGGDYYFWDGNILHREAQSNIDEDFVIEGSYWIKSPKMELSAESNTPNIIAMIREFKLGKSHPCIKTLYSISKMFGDKPIYFNSLRVV